MAEQEAKKESAIKRLDDKIKKSKQVRMFIRQALDAVKDQDQKDPDGNEDAK